MVGALTCGLCCCTRATFLSLSPALVRSRSYRGRTPDDLHPSQSRQTPRTQRRELTMRNMTAPMKLAWWLTLALTLAVWVFGFIRLHIHAWTSGGTLVALTVVLAVGLRLTCDDVMGVRTGS